MNQPNPPKRGLLLEDETVVGGSDKHGAPVVVPKNAQGKATESVKPTDPREAPKKRR